MSVYRNTRSISGHTRISETKVQQTWVNDTYIPTIIPRAGGVVMINVGLAQARPDYHSIIYYM